MGVSIILERLFFPEESPLPIPICKPSTFSAVMYYGEDSFFLGWEGFVIRESDYKGLNLFGETRGTPHEP